VAPDRDYQLGALRDSRARDEHARRGEVADAAGGTREARARLDGARARTHAARVALNEAAAARDRLLDAGSTPARLAQAERYVTRRRHELDAALGEELRAEAAHAAQQSELDLQRRLLARARAERQVIDRHFARWREERSKLAERRGD
jgi:hypothetical protein